MWFLPGARRGLLPLERPTSLRAPACAQPRLRPNAERREHDALGPRARGWAESGDCAVPASFPSRWVGWLSPAATAAASCAASSLSSALAPRLPPAPARLSPPTPRAPLPHLPLAGSLSSCLRSRLLPAARAPLPASPPPAASPPWCLPARLGRRSSPAPAAPGLRSVGASSAPQWLGPDATGAERAGRAELREASDAPPGWGPGALASSPCPLVITGLCLEPGRSLEETGASQRSHPCRVRVEYLQT